MKKKILISAYSCEPDRGSESEVGWNWVINLSDLGHEVYVITRANQKNKIYKYISKKNIENLHFIYFDFPKLVIKIFKGKSNAFSYLYFYLWQIGIFFVAKNLIKRINFDFIHHVTFVSYRFPSFLCLLDAPFIFGPISGGDEIPKKLKKSFDFKSRLKEYFRELDNKLVKIYPLLNLTFKKSKKIIVTSFYTQQKISKKYHNKILNELAISPSNLEISEKDFIKDYYSEKIQICFAGVFEHRKGIHILMNVIKKLKENHQNFVFNFFGKGYLQAYMENFITKYDLINYTKFHGEVDRNYLKNQMKINHLLLFPSLRDSGGYVLFEAMSVGLPSIVINLGGPPKIINNNCGFIIDHEDKTEDEIINEYFHQTVNLIKNREKLKFKSQQCFSEIKKFSWKNKINKIYNF